MIGESTIKWAKSARRFIALQDEEFLSRAIEYSKQTDREITLILTHHFNREVNKAAALTGPLFKDLITQHRQEEALTLALLILMLQAKTVEQIDDRSSETSLVQLERGMQACQQAIQYSEELQDEPCKAVFSVILAEGFRFLRQFNEASEACAQALAIYGNLADFEPQIYLPYVAENLNRLAVLQKNQDRFKEAEQAYTEALKIRLDLALVNASVHLPEVAETLNNFGVFYAGTNESEKAEEAYTEALQIYRALTSSDPNFSPAMAQTLNNIAILQKDKNEFTLSEQSYQESFNIYKTLAQDEPQIYLPYLAGLLNNIAILQRDKNEFTAAETSYLKALQIYRNLSGTNPQTYSPDLGQTLNNLGAFYSAKNEPEMAENCYQSALSIYRILVEDNPAAYLPFLALTLNNLAALFYSEGQLEAAGQFYIETLNIYKSLAQANPKVYLFYLGLTLNNLGALYRTKNELAAAEQFYTTALQIRHNLAANSQIYLSDAAGTLNNLGELKQHQNQFEEAEQAYTEALKIRRDLALVNASAHLPEVAETLNNLGNLQKNTSKFKAAEKSYTEALKIYRALVESNSQPFLPYLALVLNNFGYLSIAKQKYKSALRYFEEAREIISRLRNIIQDIGRRKQIFQKNLNVYDGLLLCYIKLENWEKAIEIAEQGKSSSLNDHLGLQAFHPSISADETPENKAKLAKHFQQYIDTIKNSQITESLISAYFQELIYINDNSSRSRSKRENLERVRKEAEKHLFDLRHNRESLLTEIRLFDPEYPPQVEGLKFQEILNVSRESKHAIVIFRVLEETTFIVTIFPDGSYEPLEIPGFTNRQLNKISLEEISLMPSEQLRAARERDAVFGQAAGNSHLISNLMVEINEKLITPVRDALKNKKLKDAVFVTSGRLAVLPLQSCFDKTGDRYLIEDFNIKFITSISLFKKCRELRQKRRRIDKLMFVTNPRNDLPFAEKEVESICKIYGLDHENYQHNLIREKATLAEVQKRLSQDFDIIHFACHGSYDWKEPFSSPLKMANNKSLSLKEIMQIRLSKARLIVLSACKTGLVDFRDVSDEHYGFPFGFILAGSPSVWGTLWSIDDKATSVLLEKAYRRLREGMEISEALRQSQIEMSRDQKYNSPYYWAGFQHFGA